MIKLKIIKKTRSSELLIFLFLTSRLEAQVRSSSNLKRNCKIMCLYFLSSSPDFSQFPDKCAWFIFPAQAIIFLMQRSVIKKLVNVFLAINRAVIKRAMLCLDGAMSESERQAAAG